MSPSTRRGASHQLALALFLFSLTGLTTLAALLTPFHDPEQKGQLRSRAGNDSAGSDIYGLGVRVGFYLQGFAFTLNALTSETRKGMLLAAAAVQAAILASLSVLLCGADISPAEVLIIIDELGFATLPATMALLSVDSGGQGLGVALFVVDTLWYNGILTWFWARGYRSLPLLGTSNAAFFYVRVDLGGWFRTLNLVGASLLWVAELGLVVYGMYLVRKSMGYYWEKRVDNDDDEPPKLIDVMLHFAPLVAVGSLVLTLPLLIVGAERMIQWNGLLPTSDLSAPGQVIPFGVGLVSLVDAILGVLRHSRPGDHFLRSARTGRNFADSLRA